MWPGELLKRVELLGRPCQLEDDCLLPEVDRTPAERRCGGDELGAPVGTGRDLQEQQLPLDRLARHQLRDAQDVHELVDRLLDLLQRMLLAVDA